MRFIITGLTVLCLGLMACSDSTSPSNTNTSSSANSSSSVNQSSSSVAAESLDGTWQFGGPVLIEGLETALRLSMEFNQGNFKQSFEFQNPGLDITSVGGTVYPTGAWLIEDRASGSYRVDGNRLILNPNSCETSTLTPNLDDSFTYRIEKLDASECTADTVVYKKSGTELTLNLPDDDGSVMAVVFTQVK
jgi:hypothetical protein